MKKILFLLSAIVLCSSEVFSPIKIKVNYHRLKADGLGIDWKSTKDHHQL
jgi:hypothetical protein